MNQKSSSKDPVVELNKVLKKKKMMTVGWVYIKKQHLWQLWKKKEKEVEDFNKNKKWWQLKQELNYEFSRIYCMDTLEEQFILEQAGVLDKIDKFIEKQLQDKSPN